MGCLNSVAVAEPQLLPAALAIVRAVVRDIDRTCSRFRDDSELARVNRSGGRPVALTPLFEEALQAALRTAEMTGGLVDPTVGTHLREIGYTVTFRDLPADGPSIRLRVQALPDWTVLEYSPDAHTLRVPPGTSLDFGASGKAWAADRAARAAAERLAGPVLVSCGGDLAVAGPRP